LNLGRVIGNLHSTVKNEGLRGQRFLLVQPVNALQEPKGNPLVCLDWAGARNGDLIWWCRGREASFPLLPQVAPTDATIVAIVDQLDLMKGAAEPKVGLC
jgi:ethanolamine utilization protein EutN